MGISQYSKRSFPISFIGIGDFENVRILKEGKAFNLGVIWKMGNSLILKEGKAFNLGVIWKMGNSLILKEGKAFNLGDGKFSGFPKFEMMASLGNFETLNFQTLGGNSERRDA